MRGRDDASFDDDRSSVTSGASYSNRRRRMNALQLLQRKKNRKLRREMLTAVNGAIALGMKQSLQRNPSRACAIKSSFKLRFKSSSTEWNAAIKDGDAVNWDNPSIGVGTVSLFQTAIVSANRAGKFERARRLQQDLWDIAVPLIIDMFINKPSANKALWESLFEDNPSLTGIKEAYLRERENALSISDNFAKNINYSMPICMDYNLASCDGKCGLLHICLWAGHEERESHPLKYCQHNTAKSKMSKVKQTKRSSSWKYSYGRGGYNRGYRYNNFNNRPFNNFNPGRDQRANRGGAQRGNRERFGR